jgi:hypothetical protein
MAIPANVCALVPDSLRRRFDGPHSDVWLIANNPKLRRFALEELALGPDSLLVQFNGARFFDRLAARDCLKDFLFVGRRESYHGFAGVGAPGTPLSDQALRRLRIGLIGGTPEPHLPALQHAFPEADWVHVPTGSLVMRGYPARLTASSGFVVLQIHLAIEQARAATGLAPRPIHLVGFTGFARRAWPGHDWWAEQKALRSAAVIRHGEEMREGLHALRAVRWWVHHCLALRHGRKA